MIVGKIIGLQKLRNKFKELQKEAKRQTLKTVVVGYSAAYALYVHEKVEMKWKGLPRGQGFSVNKKGQVVVPKHIMHAAETGGKVGGANRGFYWDPQGRAQAKFLEQPAREMQDELGRVCAEIVKQTGSMEQGLLAAGLRLQRESMKLVPIDTGNLRASAYTRAE